MSTTQWKTRLPMGRNTDSEIPIEYRTPRPRRRLSESRSLICEIQTNLGVRTENDDYPLAVFAQCRPRHPRFTAHGVIADVCSAHKTTQ